MTDVLELFLENFGVGNFLENLFVEEEKIYKKVKRSRKLSMQVCAWGYLDVHSAEQNFLSTLSIQIPNLD